MHGSVEDTKLSTNKQHSLSRNRGTLWEKEAAEVPEVPCWELLKNLELSKSEIFSFMAENNLTHQTGLTRTKRVEKEKEYSQRDE